MTEYVELKMGSRQTPGFFLFPLILSLQPIYTVVILTWVLELVEMELV